MESIFKPLVVNELTINLSLVSFLADLIEKVFKRTTLTDKYFLKEIDHDEFRKKMDLLGYTAIGAGVYRTVFTHQLTPDVVYKFGNWESNGREYTLWNYIPNYKRNKLATIYYTNGNVNVMEKIEFVVKDKLNSGTIVEKAITELIDNTLFIEDTHPGNWGIRTNGDVVLIDYGDYHGVPNKNSDLSVKDYPNWERFYRFVLGNNRISEVRTFQSDYAMNTSYDPLYEGMQFNTAYIPLIIEQKEEQLLLEVEEEVNGNKPVKVEESLLDVVVKEKDIPDVPLLLDFNVYMANPILSNEIIFDNPVKEKTKKNNENKPLRLDQVHRKIRRFF